MKSETLFTFAMLVLFCLIAVCCKADAETIVVTTEYSDGTTNTWTQSDLQSALGLMNRKYHRDMQSSEGRKAWHGNEAATLITTNETSGIIEKAVVYDDGYVHREQAHKKTTPTPVSELIKKQLPADVLKILQAREAAKSATNTVTVVTEVK